MSEQHPVLAAIEERRESLAAERAELVEQAAQLEQQIDSIEQEFVALNEAAAALKKAISDDSEQETAGPGDPPTPGPAKPAKAPVETDEPPPESGPKRVFGENGDGPSRGGQRAMEQSARKEKVLEELRRVAKEEPPEISAGELAKRCDLDTGQSNNTLRTLEREGKVTRRGKNRWTRWRLFEAKVRPVTEGPTKRERGSEEAVRKGSLEGRIMQACMMDMLTLEQIAARIGDVPPVSVNAAVGKLYREGELRTKRKDGKLLYVFAG